MALFIFWLIPIDPDLWLDLTSLVRPLVHLLEPRQKVSRQLREKVGVAKAASDITRHHDSSGKPAL